VLVRLTRFEVLAAALVGVRRRLESWGSAETNKVGNGSFGWQIDIEAACAEMAAAKALNLYWSGSVNTFKLPDVGEGVEGLQVRHTDRDGGCLIVRPEDKGHERFLLVTGQAPLFVLRGWLRGDDARQDAFWRDPNGHRPAWFVPQSALRPVGELEGVA